MNDNILTFNEKLEFSNGYIPFPDDTNWLDNASNGKDIQTWDKDGNLYLVKDHRQTYDIQQLKNAVFENFMDAIIIRYYTTEYHPYSGSGSKSSIDLKFTINFDRQPTYDEMMRAIRKEFNKALTELEKAIVMSTEMYRGDYVPRTRYDAWHPDECPFYGPLVPIPGHPGCYEMQTYRWGGHPFVSFTTF